MSDIKSFDEILQHFAAQTPKKRVATVAPHDDHTQKVVEQCLESGLAHFILVNSRPDPWADRMARKYPGTKVINTTDVDSAAAEAVAIVHDGDADVIMKGSLNTDNLLHAVLNKECGLLPQGKVLTHITAAKIPTYDKVLFFSDAAVIPQPDLNQLRAMITYDVDLLHKLKIERPRIALIHFTEKSNPKFQDTVYYGQLKQMAADGLWGKDLEIDGPMDVKSACDRQSAMIKHIDSPVCGHADLLIFPNLVAANTFYKAISLFSHATMAGIIMGASAPIVIPSRADTAESKFYSLALACIAHT